MVASSSLSSFRAVSPDKKKMPGMEGGTVRQQSLASQGRNGLSRGFRATQAILHHVGLQHSTLQVDMVSWQCLESAQPRPCLSPLHSSRCRDLRWARFPGHQTSWYHRGQTDCAGPMQASHSSNMFKITFDKTHIALTQIWLKELTVVTSCFIELCTLSEFRGG